MNDDEADRLPERKNRCLATAALFMAGLAVWALFACWTLQRTDSDMRADLLQQTRMAAQGLSIERIQKLTGTETDRDSSHYHRLKEQLSAFRLANPKCRWLYLMGRKPDGAVFFFLDSEPAGSRDYSPPGQVYEEAASGYRNVFDTKAEVVVGPANDRWGTWISGLVPIYDPQTGTLLTVLGMDIDARDWKWNVVSRAALPAGLMLALLIGVVVACRFTPR